MIYSTTAIEIDIPHIIDSGKTVFLEEDLKHPDGGALMFAGSKIDPAKAGSLLKKGVSRARITPNPNIVDYLLAHYKARYDEDNLYELFPEELRSNMVLRQDIQDDSGKQLFAMGTLLNISKISIIKELMEDELIMVYVPPEKGITEDRLLNQDIGDLISDISADNQVLLNEDIIRIVQENQHDCIAQLVNLYLKIYNQQDPRIQTLVWALGSLQAEKAIPAFFKTFNEIEDDTLLEKIIWAFGEIKNKRALMLIKRILRDPDASTDIKWACIFAIKAIGPDKEVETLIAAFKNKVLAKTSESDTLTIKSDPKNLQEIRSRVETWSKKKSFTEQIIYNIMTAVDEAVMNVIEHGYNYDATKDITVEFYADNEKVTFTIIGGEKEYNLKRLGNVDLEQHIKNRSDGGLGIYFFKKFMDDVQLTRTHNGLNKLVLTKYCKK